MVVPSKRSQWLPTWNLLQFSITVRRKFFSKQPRLQTELQRPNNSIYCTNWSIYLEEWAIATSIDLKGCNRSKMLLHQWMKKRQYGLIPTFYKTIWWLNKFYRYIYWDNCKFFSHINLSYLRGLWVSKRLHVERVGT